jgi:hypothetical protein
MLNPQPGGLWYATGSIALRVVVVLKLPYLDKVETPAGETF